MTALFRNRFGVPGAISVIALIFAMGLGGAYAASDDGGATASAKKGKPGPPGPRGKRGPTGPAGAAGAVGPAGPAGPAGPQGSAGPQGPVGPAGAKGATGPVGPTGAKGATGATGPTGPTGDEGSPWVVGTAPEGVVMKGTWSIQQYTAVAANETIPVLISTGVPVNPTASGLLAHYLAPAVADPGHPLGCTGTAAEPSIVPKETAPGEFNDGLVCVYGDPATAVNLKGHSGPVTGNFGKTGGGIIPLLRSVAAGDVKGYGGWALITPEE